MNRPDVMPRQAWPGPMPGPDAPVGTAAFGHTRATRIAACCFVSLLLSAFIGTAPFDEWAMSVDTGQGRCIEPGAGQFPIFVVALCYIELARSRRL